jgi:hypothetical protein
MRRVHKTFFLASAFLTLKRTCNWREIPISQITCWGVAQGWDQNLYKGERKIAELDHCQLVISAVAVEKLL